MSDVFDTWLVASAADLRDLNKLIALFSISYVVPCAVEGYGEPSIFTIDICSIRKNYISVQMLTFMIVC